MKTENKSRQFPLRDRPDILEILLKDRTTKNNIKWATNDYEEFGFNLNPETEIDIRWLTNGLRNIVQPRVKKELEIQKERTKEKAEVFTPTWIVEKQVNYVDKELKNLSLEDYINKTWLEITCGEAPYICTRYDSTTGEPLQLDERVGFLDKKLNRISKETQTKEEWLNHTTKAYQSTYGYEYHGDSLLIARENLLFTFIDYYIAKFNELPEDKTLKNIANIISYNIIQMDGLNYTIPYSSKQKTVTQDVQLDLFKSLEESEEQATENIQVDTNAKIKLWNTNKIIEFNQLEMEGQDNMKFDVVIGNPPYQESVSDSLTNQHDMPIYHYFYNAAEKIGKIYCLISPARFLTNSGYTPKKWNRKMLNDENLKIVKYISDSSEVFTNTDIKGGVVILMRNSTKVIGPIEFFTPNKLLTNIAKKVITHLNGNSLKDILYVQSKMNLDLVYEDYPDFKDKRPKSSIRDVRFGTDSLTFFSEMLSSEPTKKNNIEIFGLLPGNKRASKYVNEKYLNLEDQTSTKINTYRVLVPAASGSGKLGETISTPLVISPNVGHTMSFRTLGSFKDLEPAENLLKYIKTKFTRAMIGAQKTTQHMPPRVFTFVPLQDFTATSDIDWSKSIKEIDQQLYKKYGLNDEEINFIETNVKEME